MTDAEMAEAVCIETASKKDDCVECGEHPAGECRACYVERALVAATARAERAEAALAAVTTGTHRVLASERARAVEAIAAWHDEASGIDSSHGNSFQAFTHALSADHIRSHNWAPPEEDGDE